jgi:hypothetical protein
MNRPRRLVRLAGSPRGALLLFIGYAVIVYGWYQGDVPWWLAVGAVAAGFRTLAAVGRMRRYKAWLADWQGMGAGDEPPRPKKRRGWVLVAGAALLVVAIPLVQPETGPNDALTVLWCVACLYLVFALVRGILRRIRGRRKVKAEVAQTRDEAAPVAWLVPRAASSPSRADAMRSVPDYCARLMASR